MDTIPTEITINLTLTSDKSSNITIVTTNRLVSLSTHSYDCAKGYSAEIIIFNITRTDIANLIIQLRNAARKFKEANV